MFASRYLLHQNWLKGKCSVRTFEGHTQGTHYNFALIFISDFVTNNYGESWDSCCEQSWVSVQNQWVPWKKTSPKLKMLGPFYNQTVNLKTDPKTLYYSIVKFKCSPSNLKHNKGNKKYALLNNSHNNCHRNYTNEIFLQIHMFRSVNQYLWMHAMNYLHLGGFLCVRDTGYRGSKITDLQSLILNLHQFSIVIIWTFSDCLRFQGVVSQLSSLFCWWWQLCIRVCYMYGTSEITLEWQNHIFLSNKINMSCKHYIKPY